MDWRIEALVARGRGLATGRELRAAGIDPRRIAALVRSGQLVPVRRGVYTTAERWESWDEWLARPLARVRAAHLAMSVPHVFSHDSAALLLRLPLIDPRRSEVHVTRGSVVVGSQMRYGVRHHGAPFADDQVRAVDGLDTLDECRTVADMARTHGYNAGLVAADRALRQGHSQAALLAAIEPMSCWPGVTTARAVATDADRGAETAAETLARILVKELGVEDVETQFPIRTAHGVRWVDIRAERHLYEVDGRIKYLPAELGGVADGRAEEVLWREKKRERDLTSPGLGLSRIVWQDFWEPHRSRARQRLRAELDETRRRFGTEVPAALLEDAQIIRAQQPRIVAG